MSEMCHQAPVCTAIGAEFQGGSDKPTVPTTAAQSRHGEGAAGLLPDAYQPDAFALKEQADWEVEATRQAIESFRRSLRDAVDNGQIAGLPTSQRLLREIVPPLATAIAAAQEQGKVHIGSAGRHSGEWCWPIQMLTPEKLSVITMTHCLRCTVSPVMGDDGGSLMTSLMLAIAASVRDQVEFDSWTAGQKAANKAAAEAHDEEHVDLLRAFERRYPNADRRTWAKWRKKIDALRAESWDKPTCIALGGYLIGLLLETAPHRFEKRELPSPRGQAPSYYLQVTAETAELLRDISARAEVARPALLPMIMPPIPWAYPPA